MPSYIALHAELYDHLYREKDYRKESAFVHALLKIPKPANSRILEIACGTGTHAFLLEKRGYQILAIDNSPSMLRVARRKALAVQSHTQFRSGDMRKLPVFTQSFDGAICLFDSIGYALTNDGVLRTLQGIHKNLRKKGRLVFEFWHAAAMISHYEKKRVRKFRADGAVVVRTSETTLDLVRQTARIRYSLRVQPQHGKERSASEIQENRFFSIPEMTLLLEAAGFTDLCFYNGFTRNTHIDQHTWHIVAVAQKK